ncbi:MAG: sigma-54 dependent transcriptional regulator [Myxococcota bacterium]|jgi:two-component system response regulator HydG|nr:sigma-54 dependent transcriptional regulator [Myxococcota bacterium]
MLLIVDDERANLGSLERIFAREGYVVRGVATGEEALDLLRNTRVNVLLTDLKLPGLSGVDLLRHARTLCPETEVILMTAFGTVETAVLAMKEGAYDFITKPFKRNQVVKSVAQALERQRLVAENRALRAELDGMLRDREVIGASLALRRTLDLIHQAAPSSVTVLLEGESGTGKELLARMVHDRSARRGRPFIAVNLAALPETIIESELFGHERGAFTGAAARKEGRFTLAHGGTLFLDEIAEVPPQVQVKLLRVLQEGEFERLGGTGTLRVDVRIVAATNRELLEEVASGRFRQDLFYRLNVIHIRVPPLRERRDDIPLLANYFLGRFCSQNNKKIKGFQREALDFLETYHWPGNVRELQGVIERAVVLTRNEFVTSEDLPEHIRHSQDLRAITIPLGTPLEEIERQVIRETLRLTKGDKRRTAQLLGIATRTVYRKLDRL